MNLTKRSSESLVTKSDLILPNDTNMFNNMMGGNLMYQMDIVAAIAAQRHCNNEVVTASVDNISFQQPIKLGNVITLKAFVTRAFKTSMEVKIEVHAEDIPQGIKYKSNEAFLTFVSINKDGTPQEVPGIEPETEEEQELYNSALRRRELRLILGGKISPNEATDLKKLFDEN
ncbi:acyl-CoA thioesterase [Cyclobacteriaceae bacterium]|nr:acyl-CoA thioesterase [Cyclobacteriaceae bacterium]